MPNFTGDMIFWLAALVIFLIVEAATVGLVSIWFAAGALAALVASLFHLSIWIQVIAFIIISAVTLVFTRPLARKLLRERKQPTNLDMLYDMPGIVSEAINNIDQTGAVKISGKEWTARSASGAPISKDTVVRVISIEGVKLIVRPATETAGNKNGG